MDYKVEVPEGKSGIWEIKRFEVKREDFYKQIGSFYSSGGRFVPEGIYTSITRNGKCIMSDTPDEFRDHIHFVYKATGEVLIVGLGLGMVINAILQIEHKEKVHITVIEKDQDVLKLVQPHYEKKFPNQITFIQANIWDWKPPKNQKWDYAWFDIWDNLCMDNLEEMAKLHRKFARKVTWKGSWGKKYLQDRKRQEKRNSWRRYY